MAGHRDLLGITVMGIHTARDRANVRRMAALPIPVGFQWKHIESGKEWVVTGLRPGGICEIYRIGRHISGETQTRIVRSSIEDGTAVQVETSEAARKILRRLNGRDFAA